MKDHGALLAQKPLVDKYLKLQTHHLSPFHFSSIFLWQDFFDFDFQVINGSLCIFANQKGASFVYLPPLGKKDDPQVWQQCFTSMNKVNPRTARIENMSEAQIQGLGSNFKSNVKVAEYVYAKQDLIDLKGQAYKSQRHDIHHFQLHHQALFRPYEPTDLKACLSLYERWAKNRYDKHEDNIYRSMLEENRIVHELALNYSKPLELLGYVVEIDQKIVAYSLGYSLNSQTFCVLLEIADVTKNGLNAFIFNRICAHDDLRQYVLINTMDDFGLPYVAASKQAYHPSSKPVSYTITQVR